MGFRVFRLRDSGFMGLGFKGREIQGSRLFVIGLVDSTAKLRVLGCFVGFQGLRV